MKKRIISVITVLCMAISFFTTVYAQGEPSLSLMGESAPVCGKSVVLKFDNIIPGIVSVNGSAVDEDKYIIDSKMNKLYIYGSIFDLEGDYTIGISDENEGAEITINFSDNTTEKEYSIDDDCELGDEVSRTSTAGTEHSATGNRRPIKVSLNENKYNSQWIKWKITDSGLYTIDYWCANPPVNAPVTVMVADKNGEHIFIGIVSEEADETKGYASYTKLRDENGDAYIFDFSGDGDYYLKAQAYTKNTYVGNTNEGSTQQLVLFDSFKITSLISEHDKTVPEITADKYTVEDGKIKGVLFNSAEKEFIENIFVPADCTYELDMADEYVSEGDTLAVYKLFDNSIKTEYTVGKVLYLSSTVYTLSDNKISNVPYGEDYSTFISNIQKNDQIVIKVFSNGEEKTEGTVETGDIIAAYLNEEEVERYEIDVIPASGENFITSSVYTVEEDKIIIPYGEKAKNFMDNISVSPFAAEEHRYIGKPDMIITKSFAVKVTAQNGNVRIYTAIIDLNNSNKSELISSYYTVSSNSVGVVEADTDAGDFLEKLSASNGGELKMYDENMKEKVAGKVKGTDTLRVYPRYKSASEEYTSYSIKVQPEYKRASEDEIIWSCANDSKNPAEHLEFTCTNYEDGNNFTTKRVGYNGTNADRAKNSYYNYTAVADKTVKLNYFAVASVAGQNNTYKVEVFKNNTKIADKQFIIQNSTLCDLGYYELKRNDVLTVYIDGQQFISAAVITEVTFFEAQINNYTFDDEDFGGFDVIFNFDADENTIPDGIKIVSENGNIMPYTYDAVDGGYRIKTKYPIERGVRYFVIVYDSICTSSGEFISVSTTAGVPELLDKVRATVRSDYIIGDETAEIELGIISEKSTDIKVLIVQYGDMGIIKVETDEVSVNANTLMTKMITVNSENGCNRIGVYLIDNECHMITDTYYAD